MGTQKARAQDKVCNNPPTLEAMYGVLVDLERRIHVLRQVVSHLDPKTRLQFVEKGIGAGFVPVPIPQHIVICTNCMAPIKWDPFLEQGPSDQIRKD